MLTANEFWRLSQALYRTPGVQAACLQAQDKAGADVNLLLLLALLGARGWRGELAPLLAASARLAALLQPWRALRRRLQPRLGEPDYQALLSHELALERLAQEQLLAVLPACAGQPQPLAGEPLHHYLDHLGLGASPLHAQLAALGPLARTLAIPHGKEPSC